MIPLVDKYRPSTLADFAGLDAPRAILSKIAAKPYSSAWLLTGGSGLGKTSMAFAVAETMKAQVHHLASRQCDLDAVDRLVSSCRSAPMFAESSWHVPIIDEADKMTQPAQLAFLSVLDGTVPCPNTVFFFTTNDATNLEPRFRSRCRPIRFEPEPKAHVALLARIWSAETSRPAPDLAAILENAGGNIRTALMTLEVELIAPGAFTPKPAARAMEAAPRLRCDARSTKRGVDARLPPVGTVLARTFRERRIKVEVLADGFRFERRRYTSLSAIAGEINQKKRNGYEFFGLTSRRGGQ